MALAAAIQGARRPSQLITWTDETGMPVDLSEAIITARIRNLSTGQTRNSDGVFVVTDPAAAGTPWQTTAVATGTAGYFRIFNNAGTQCHVQGLVAITGGTGELILDNTSIATGQNVSIQNFSLTAANA